MKINRNTFYNNLTILLFTCIIQFRNLAQNTPVSHLCIRNCGRYNLILLRHVSNWVTIPTAPAPNMNIYFFCPFSYSKLSIRFHHILLKQLHQENDSACGINYACTWPKTKGYEVGEVRIVRHTQIKSPWISQMDPISSSYCLKSSCT